MQLTVRNKSKKWIGWVVFALFLLAGLGAVAWVYYHPRGGDSQVQSTETPKQPEPVAVTSNSLFFGNAYFGRYINDWSMASDLKYAYPFSRLNEFKRDEYNAWVAGLECPTVAGVTLTSAEEDETLSFNCDPGYLPEAAKWFTAFTMANNHTDNQGAEGFMETRKHLDENGIQYFGNYDPTVEADVCEVVSWPVTVTYDDKSEKPGTLPIALCALHGVFQIPPEESIAIIERYAQYMPVIAMPHMGVEYQAAPDELKTSVYRSLIDHGADMVLGDHPHWIQTTEAYNGRLIVYSMGNFLFDQQDTAEVVRSAAIRVVMQTGDTSKGELKEWLAIGDSCKRFQDDCLAQVQIDNLTKLPFTYQFGAIGTNDSQKIVKPATEEQQASILQRLKWETTMAELEAPYSELTE